jgi:NAD(P)-dependent dehydrogenase (short-subunit alcohol dehydrogenase family)
MSSVGRGVSMTMTGQLTGKNAIIYGGGGALGGAIAGTFARRGAAVFLAGRTADPLERVAAGIAAAGGRAEVAVLDALDERAVDAHADEVAARAGSVDISFNLVTRGDVQGTPLVEMALPDYVRAITDGTATAFITARAAARHMVPQGGGVLLHLTSGASRGAAPGMGNTGPADAATELFMRSLAAELGASGIRVVGIHTAGVAGTLTREKLEAVNPGIGDAPVAAITEMIAARTMLGRVPTEAQIADTAAFLASDGAGAITGTTINATCGLVAG